MRLLLRVVLLSAIGSSLAAQGLLPATVRAAAAAGAVAANCGLQATADGSGWLGGGKDYRVRFTAEGMRYDAALGPAAPATRFVALRAAVVRRGAVTLAAPLASAPAADGADAADAAGAHRIRYARGDGLTERYDLRADGVLLSWRIANRPAGHGDLVVRYAVDTNLGAPAADGDGLGFADAYGGIAIGGVTGIDADDRTVAGRIAWVDGGLERSLPDAFVEHCTYPLVLDPTIGTTIAVSTGANADGEPDAAYDRGTGRFLVVFRRTFAATDSDVRGQMVWSTGQLAGSTVFFGSNGTVSPPRVASLGNCNRFGVVWSQLVAGTSAVVYQGVEATSGALDPLTPLDTTTTSVHGPADIGSDPDAYPNQTRGCCVVWEDDDFDAIRMERVFYFGGGIALAGQVSLWINGILGPSYSAPALSRACTSDGWLLLAVQRTSPLTGGSAIDARTVRVDGSLVGIVGTIASSSTQTLAAPDVDGQDGHWVVAHERQGGGSTYDAVVVTPVADGGGTTIAVGAPVTFGGSPLARASHPSVGYGLGRAWIGYQQVNVLPTVTTSLRVAAVDATSCATCNDTFAAPLPGGARIVVATTLSGGDTFREHVLAAWHASSDDISAQLLQNYGTSGTTIDLGGGCGGAGTVSFAHEPGIGSNSFYCRLQNVPTTTLAAIFNVAAPSNTVACGTCVWTPFAITVAPPILGSIASVGFPIPCLPSLVGAQFDTQWTTIDLTKAPCPMFPGLALSTRTRLTIGQ